MEDNDASNVALYEMEDRTINEDAEGNAEASQDSFGELDRNIKSYFMKIRYNISNLVTVNSIHEFFTKMMQ